MSGIKVYQGGEIVEVLDVADTETKTENAEQPSRVVYMGGNKDESDHKLEIEVTEDENEISGEGNCEQVVIIDNTNERVEPTIKIVHSNEERGMEYASEELSLNNFSVIDEPPVANMAQSEEEFKPVEKEIEGSNKHGEVNILEHKIEEDYQNEELSRDEDLSPEPGLHKNDVTNTAVESTEDNPGRVSNEATMVKVSMLTKSASQTSSDQTTTGTKNSDEETSSNKSDSTASVLSSAADGMNGQNLGVVNDAFVDEEVLKEIERKRQRTEPGFVVKHEKVTNIYIFNWQLARAVGVLVGRRSGGRL